MKPFKKFDSKTDKLLFCSDLHINHTRDFVWKDRGFKSPEEHTEFILNALYRLSSDTTLVFVGDFALNSTTEQIKSVLSTVKCQILFIHGNHESAPNQIIKEIKQGFQEELRERDIWPIKYKTTTFLGYCGAISVDKEYIYLQHMAQFIWPYIPEGSWHLCGHSHGSCKELNLKETKSGKILDCGVDNALKYNNGESPFFTWPVIKHIMQNKQIMVRDHHTLIRSKNGN